ncbi:hypothetical protein [Desulfolithobacter sp.]
MNNIDALEAVYRFHASLTERFGLVCVCGCVTCCTVNVTMTSLEADYLRRAEAPVLQEPKVDKLLREVADRPHFMPSRTTNELANACLQRLDAPVETGKHGEGNCPLLDRSGCCMVYDHRPFGCRAMVSLERCVGQGEAVMPPFLFTLNLALCQVIEHLDRDGISGNMLDLLTDHQERCIPNRALPGFLVPAREKLRFTRVLDELKKVVAGDGVLADFLPDSLLLP